MIAVEATHIGLAPAAAAPQWTARRSRAHAHAHARRHPLECRAAYSDTDTSSGSSSGAAPPPLPRRAALLGLAAAAAGLQLSRADADDFVTAPSGLKIQDIRAGGGSGPPRPGDTVVVDWEGFTKGYQGKRIGNTTRGADEPYEFVLGGGQAIAAFEEAVADMRVGGVRRIEVPGDRPELGYPRDRAQRFVPASGAGLFRYAKGPQPAELGGQRALDFVLDEKTLRDFNRTLLFDIKVLAVRPPRK